MDSPHRRHEEIAQRLQRAEGHLRSIIRMIADQKPCVEIAHQLHAVEKAVVQAKKALIQDHLDHCLEDVAGTLPDAQRRSIDDFKTITKYL